MRRGFGGGPSKFCNIATLAHRWADLKFSISFLILGKWLILVFFPEQCIDRHIHLFLHVHISPRLASNLTYRLAAPSGLRWWRHSHRCPFQKLTSWSKCACRQPESCQMFFFSHCLHGKHNTADKREFSNEDINVCQVDVGPKGPNV